MEDGYGEKVPTHDVTARNQQIFIKKHIYALQVFILWYVLLFPVNNSGLSCGTMPCTKLE
jgi:hypothetical protein